MTIMKCNEFLHGYGIITSKVEFCYCTKLFVTELLSHFYDNIFITWNFNLDYSICFRPFCNTLIYKSIDNDTLDVIYTGRIN